MRKSHAKTIKKREQVATTNNVIIEVKKTTSGIKIET